MACPASVLPVIRPSPISLPGERATRLHRDGAAERVKVRFRATEHELWVLHSAVVRHKIQSKSTLLWFVWNLWKL